MKLTKFVHACVLVEDERHTALFDPGDFSWASGLFNISQLNRLDKIIITHEHSDHFSLDFVKALVAKFPDVSISTTQEVIDQLQKVGIKKASDKSDKLTDIKYLAHESMEPLAPPPCQNVRVHYKGKVTHPGDSHHLEDTKDILLLPVAGPWGATIESLRMADKLTPKTIVPIHDWMWNDDWRNTMYGRFKQFFKERQVRFIKPKDGEMFEA